MNKTMRFLGQILSFSIVLCILCTLIGCDNNGKTELKGGFIYSYSDEMPSDYCGYQSNTTEFNINDVSLTFYYGGIFSPDINAEKEYGRNIEQVKLYFIDDDANQVFIKETDDCYISDKYRAKWITDDNHYLIKIEYKFSEELTIPKGVFKKEIGQIGFAVWGQDLREPGSLGKFIANTYIYYKVNEEKIFLSNEQFK